MGVWKGVAPIELIPIDPVPTVASALRRALHKVLNEFEYDTGRSFRYLRVRAIE